MYFAPVLWDWDLVVVGYESTLGFQDKATGRGFM